MSVDRIMHKDIVSVGSTELVSTAIARMDEHDLGAVLVVDGGTLRGIFSERDLLKRVVAGKRDPETTTVGEVATSEVVTVEANASVRECYQLFRDHDFRHLPIVDAAGAPIGIISSRDLLGCMMVELEPQIDMDEIMATIGSLYFDVYGIDTQN